METSRSNPFIDRLIRLGDISAEEQNAVLDACEPPMEVAAGADIVSDGEEPGFSVAMLSGVAFRYKSLPDGRRQIISFQVPGDGIDVYGYALKRLDHGVSALTRCKVVHIPHERIDALITRYPRLTLTLWRQTVMDASLMLEQLVRVGQRPALERVANLFCEFAHRLDQHGQGQDGVYRLPLTQALLGQAVGLSTVHVNRVVKQLREAGLAKLSRSTLQVLDSKGLKTLGGFDPAYLDPIGLDPPQKRPPTA